MQTDYRITVAYVSVMFRNEYDAAVPRFQNYVYDIESVRGLLVFALIRRHNSTLPHIATKFPIIVDYDNGYK